LTPPLPLLLLLGLILPLSAKSPICNQTFKPHHKLCQELESDGVSPDYLNHFFKTPLAQKIDKTTARLIQPKMIMHHRSNEKRANERLSTTALPKLIKHLKMYQTIYDQAEQRYGVNREIIAAILLKETQLGTIKLKHDAFETLNSILHTLKPTTERNSKLLTMAHNNIKAVITFCHDNRITPPSCHFESSYAGAVGIPQFMPMNLGYIVSHDESRGDLGRMEDAILSVANYLHQRVAFTQLIDWQKLRSLPLVVSQWYSYSEGNKYATFIKIEYPQERDHCFACNKPDLSYLSEYLLKILDYNNTDNYAVGVLDIAYTLHQQIREQ
jgi:membrane-bound lytic murein transglycosylase B